MIKIIYNQLLAVLRRNKGPIPPVQRYWLDNDNEIYLDASDEPWEV